MSTFVGIPRIPASAPMDDIGEDARRVVRMACSLLLDYPSTALDSRLLAVRAELPALPPPVAVSLAAFCDEAEARGLREMQVHYVETFDQRRRCALGLTYYSHGDTRGRGQAILAFKEVLHRAGFDLERKELPDHLPLILEFCALDETGTAEELLRSNREGIEVIRTALRAAESPYSHLLDALVATLPEADEHTRKRFEELVSQGPPTELVGIGDLDSTPFPMSDLAQER